MIVPQEIRNREFDRGLNGYDQEEVVVYLQELAGEFEELYSQNEKLKDYLRQIRSQAEIFKETEGKLDQVLELSREKASILAKEAQAEADHLRFAAHQQADRVLEQYQLLLQRITAISNVARSILQENQDFYGEKTPLPKESDGQGTEDLATDMEILQAQIDELLQGLEEYEESISVNTPITGQERVTVESLMSPLWGKTVPVKLSKDKVVPTILEPPNHQSPKVAPVEPIPPDELQIPWRMPPVGQQKRAPRLPFGWLAVLVLVMILGLVGGYCWRHDLIPPRPWTQVSTQSPAGETGDREGSPAGAPVSQNSIPPLLQAVMDQDANQVKRLLASGIAPDAANQIGETPLMIAAYQRNTEIVQALLDAGADPNIKEKEWGVTALMYASFQGNLIITGMLLDGKADPNIRNREGWTALMCAAFAGRPKTVQLLIKRGADPYLETRDGWTAYQLALLMERNLTVKAMEKSGVTPAPKDGSGQEFTADQDMLRLFGKQEKR